MTGCCDELGSHLNLLQYLEPVLFASTFPVTRLGLRNGLSLCHSYFRSIEILFYLPMFLAAAADLRQLHVAKLKSKSQPKVASCEENNYVWTGW